ncbi:MAG: hypothetical protein IPO19_14085 [Rhodoferax sp.]|nr:hypothetical protein [Rhodoferax sp.]
MSNLSGGVAPTAPVVNVSQHEVHLLDFDGRDNKLNNDNVLFVGEEFTNRAILETALTAGGALNGSEAMLVDGGADTLAGVAQNTHTNADLITDFSVHGDDFLLGSAGLDTIKGLTGDDRVVGSMGLDDLDGGKNYYAVKVLGETQARVVVWNVWEAANPTSPQSLTADPTLAGKTISTITLIDQSESGHGTVSGLFDDTLLYQQADFNAGTSATPTRFTVTLDDYDLDGTVVQLNHGGAGHVTVDLTGNGATADDTTAAFANFENVRTVSGTGQAVAGSGQGNDTLNVALLSKDTGGVSYDLTDRATAGEVNYSADAHTSTTNPAEGDYESLVMRVDGVENVIAGLGDDLLMIDESEAAKDNSFSADLGDDRIEYQNDFTAAAPFVAEPTVTIWVNTATNTDVVEMTGGRVGAVHAKDTLTSVEIITLLGETAQGVREDDVLNVTAMTAGAIVNYNDVAVTNETAGTVPGTVRTLGGVLELTVENLYQVENVLADGDDTVILASASVMSMNSHTDVDGTDEENIQIDSFLNFDFINADDLTDRLSLVELASGEDDVVIGDPTPLPQSLNFGQFHFSMSEVGTDTDSDTIDYSQAADSIAAVVNFDQANPVRVG